jgi:hypothetical protein
VDDVALVSSQASFLNDTQIQTPLRFLANAAQSLHLQDVVAQSDQTQVLANEALTLQDMQLTSTAATHMEAASIRLVRTGMLPAFVRSFETGVSLVARTGSVVNEGTVISGTARAEGQVASEGAVTIRAAEDIVWTSLDATRLAEAKASDPTRGNVGDLVFLAICSPRFRPEAYEDAEGDA